MTGKRIDQDKNEKHRQSYLFRSRRSKTGTLTNGGMDNEAMSQFDEPSMVDHHSRYDDDDSILDGYMRRNTAQRKLVKRKHTDMHSDANSSVLVKIKVGNAEQYLSKS